MPVGDDKSELATPKYHFWSTAQSCNVAAHHPNMFPSICKGRVTMTPDELARAARNLAHSLGIPVYIRNGRIYQHGPGVGFLPPNGVPQRWQALPPLTKRKNGRGRMTNNNQAYDTPGGYNAVNLTAPHQFDSLEKRARSSRTLTISSWRRGS